MRVSRVLVASLSALLVGISPMLATTQAIAAPSSVSFEMLDSIEPGSDELYGLAVDEGTQRAFVLDARGRSVLRYDVSKGFLSRLGSVTVATIDRAPYGLAVNSKTHQVVTVDGSSGADQIVVVDENPASPTQGTIVARVATGGVGGWGVAVDESSNRVLVVNGGSNDVSIVDLDDGSRRNVSVGARPIAFAVDNERGDFYLADDAGSAIIRIASDGSWSTTPVRMPPKSLTVSDGQLLVGSTASFGYRVESRELVTLQKVAESAPFAAPISRIQVDEERHAVFVAHNAADSVGIDVLRTGDLSAMGSGPIDGFRDLVADASTHRLVTIKSGRSSAVQLMAPHLAPSPAVTRVGGADRYAVAAATSQSSFPPGVPVAYVASGEGFADALAGAAAAGQGKGPVLLVSKGAIPDSTRAELSRLRPRKVMILGGEATVSAAVENALKASGGTVERIAAADRYATSVVVSQSVFPMGAPVVYLASGEVFPDALSASPLSGREAGPVLLTPKGTLPPAVAAELTRLAPARVVVLGGGNTVGADVADAAAAAANAPVVRIDGSDRYAVSAAASAGSFRKHTFTVYVASGEVFPDALAAGPSAISAGAPVLLVRRDGIPDAVAAELRRLAPYDIVVLGGPNTVSDAVLGELNDYLPD